MYFLESAPAERVDCLSVLGTFLYIFHKSTHMAYIEHDLEHMPSTCRCTRISQTSDFSCMIFFTIISLLVNRNN